MKCATCGEEHHLLEPIFDRPDVVVALPPTERAARVKESNDLCVVSAAANEQTTMYFVRCVLKVRLLDAGERETAWGLWVQVGKTDVRRIAESWSDPDQVNLPPMAAILANRVPGYPDTIGLPMTLRLTGPTTRPELQCLGGFSHPFSDECAQGVSTHRLMEWLKSMDHWEPATKGN